MSQKNIKVYQSHEILKGENILRISGYLRIFSPDMQSQQISSSKGKERNMENDYDYLESSQNNSNLIKYV